MSAIRLLIRVILHIFYCACTKRFYFISGLKSNVTIEFLDPDFFIGPENIPPGSLNRVPLLARGKDELVTAVGWQVTLCDPIWHVISRSGVVISIANCYIRFILLIAV